MYPVDFSANSKTSHELVKVSVPEARKVASVECSKVFLSSGSDISGMYITILVRYSTVTVYCNALCARTRVVTYYIAITSGVYIALRSS